LEKQNALLSAALVAVLRTNGDLNGTIPEVANTNAAAAKGGRRPSSGKLATGGNHAEQTKEEQHDNDDWPTAPEVVLPPPRHPRSAARPQTQLTISPTTVATGRRGNELVETFVTSSKTSLAAAGAGGGGTTTMMAWQTRVAKRRDAGCGKTVGGGGGLRGGVTAGSMEGREKEVVSSRESVASGVSGGSQGALEMYLRTRRG
jgi:hypothetical protein